MITKLLSLDEIMRNPGMLAAQPAHEIAETRIAAHAAAAALDAAHEAAVGETRADSGPLAEPSLLNAPQAAAYLGVNESFIRVKGREGILRSVAIGRYVRFTKADLDAFSRGRRK